MCFVRTTCGSLEILEEEAGKRRQERKERLIQYCESKFERKKKELRIDKLDQEESRRQ